MGYYMYQGETKLVETYGADFEIKAPTEESAIFYWEWY